MTELSREYALSQATADEPTVNLEPPSDDPFDAFTPAKGMRPHQKDAPQAGEATLSSQYRSPRNLPTRPSPPAPPPTTPAAPAEPAAPTGPTEPDAPAPQRDRVTAAFIPPALRELIDPPNRPASRWTRRRRALAGLIAALLLVTAGYLGYRTIAPYFGLGYDTGGSLSLGTLMFSVDDVRCDQHNAPNGAKVKPAGAYCVINVTVVNRARQGNYLDLGSWTADLDVGITGIRPSIRAMSIQHDIIDGSDIKDYQLVYDIPPGARLKRIWFQVDQGTGSIRVS